MRVMIVEDERIVSLALSHMVESLGHRVLGRFPSAEAALELMNAEVPDLVLMDIRLEGRMDGIEAAGIVRERWGTPVVYTSAYTDPDTKKRADATSPVAFLPKPIGFDDIKRLFEDLALAS